MVHRTLVARICCRHRSCLGLSQRQTSCRNEPAGDKCYITVLAHLILIIFYFIFVIRVFSRRNSQTVLDYSCLTTSKEESIFVACHVPFSYRGLLCLLFSSLQFPLVVSDDPVSVLNAHCCFISSMLLRQRRRRPVRSVYRHCATTNEKYNCYASYIMLCCSSPAVTLFSS